jgi:ribosomal protein S12 methylthiotransferase accessory factor
MLVEKTVSRLALRSQPRTDPRQTIVKAKRLVDEKTGIIRMLYESPCEPDAPKVFGYGSLLADSSHYGIPHASSINGSTSIIRARAIVGAIGEAVERYSAAFIPEEDLIRASYSEVRDHAIDPRTLILYSDEQYRRPGFPFVPFHDEMNIHWIEAYSLTRRVEILVPAFAVFIPYRRNGEEPPLAQLISTGLACGNTLEEAVLAGTCEVIERDAVMSMWLSRSSRPKLDCHASTSAVLQETLRRFGETRYELHLMDLTTDTKIPAIAAVAVDRSGKGPAAVVASKASLDPNHAVVGALDELAQCLAWVRSLSRRTSRESLPDLDQLSSIEDHVMWATRLDRLGHIEFMFSSSETRLITEIPNHVTDDVLHDIQNCVAMLAERGLDVLVVEITPPDIREVGLHVVRVIIPEMQPLFFGSGLERVSPRVKQHLTNPYPHPFP